MTSRLRHIKKPFFLAITLSSLLSMPAFAARVLKTTKNQKFILISNEPSRPWQLKDTVCVYQAGLTAGCGIVAKVLPTGAIVRLSPSAQQVIVGNQVKVASQQEARRMASLEAASTTTAATPSSSTDAKWNASVGLAAGGTYVFPIISIQRRLTDHFTLGLTPYYDASSAVGASASVFGLFLTGNYYSKAPYKGIWIQAGLGPSFQKTNDGVTQTSATCLGVIGTAGYRLNITNSINVGLAAGVLYFSPVTEGTITVSISGLLFTGMGDIAFRF